MNFSDWCPTMKVCRSVEDILAFKNQFPIVLKPFREYGGKGIVKIDGEQVWEGNTELSLDAFMRKIEADKVEYLGVKGRFVGEATQVEQPILDVRIDFPKR